MVRPKKVKIVDFKPEITYFKPKSVPLRDLKEVELTHVELETLRLANIEKLNQSDGAKRMNIHQSTFQRTLSRAIEKVSDALVNGKAIKIQGGEYEMPNRDGTGPYGQVRGQGRATQGVGVIATCVCTKCGHEQQHVRGKPCNQTKCPKCDNLMSRKENE